MKVGVSAAAASGAVKAVLVLTIILAAAGGVWAQEAVRKCKEQGQCSECIQTPGCVWCTKPKLGMKNCEHGASINKTSFCDAVDLQDPENEVTVVQDDELTDAKDRTDKGKGQAQDIIQLKPQRVKLRLRKGVTQNLIITFRRALAYPVDLYYLMDLSHSMSDDKQHLAAVSKVLASTLNNLTDQYTIGFGSFVDKVMMPFTDTSSSTRLNQPCQGCSKPYSFRNDMKLIKDHEMFRKGVEQAKISGNLDSPEGGFDALMQAMVCTKEIGWRDVARRILVFSTDAKFHHAGDGRLAGVVIPNDEQCHLNEQGEYTAYDQFDYPSIGQINKVAKEKNINVIFAVLTNSRLYEQLSNQIETSSFGKLQQGSSNVVDLIRKQYESISSEVSLSDNSTEDVSIVYSSACKGGPVQQTNKCGQIQENDQVTFNLEITAKKCPADGKGTTVEVKTLEDRVILDLEFQCSCDCPPDPDTSKCKDRGRLVCGVCFCDEGYYGEECQCGGDGDSSGFSEDQTQQCLASEEDTRPCSGRGVCKCGKCFCREDSVSGKYCQCDRRKCSSGMGGDCSGHGVCDCNKCVCNPGYTGHLCECLDDKACVEQGSDKVCSGRGTCECGRCRCTSQGNDTYTGRYCEDCLRCGTGKCSQFRDCVQCVHFSNGPLQHDCNTCEKSELVENLDEQMFKGARLCTFEDEDGCYVNFTYRYLEKQGKDEVFVQAERQCPEPPNILGIVFSVIGAIVAVGLITLIIWKVLTTIHDRREYAKFENESKNAKFNAEENPLYISAATTVQNPVFAAQQTK